MIMERKIGQIFEMDGIWYQFVQNNANGCNSCVFHTMCNKCANPEKGVRCGSWQRLDKRGGYYVRLLPLGDVYEQGGAMWQQYKCIEKPNTEDKRVYIADTDSDVGLIVSIRLTNPDDMESKVGEVKNENLSNTEKIGKILKPFDLQAAKSGKPVCTRDGRKARIICFDVKAKKPIAALITNDDTEEAHFYYDNGRSDQYQEYRYDLMMFPEKKGGWVNVYKGGLLDTKAYNTKKEAFDKASPKDYIATIKITWEE